MEYGDVSGALSNLSAIFISVRYIKYNENNAVSVGHVLVRVYGRPCKTRDYTKFSSINHVSNPFSLVTSENSFLHSKRWPS